jgi:uncharacterized membrane protein YbhN (UPF0104 family)
VKELSIDGLGPLSLIVILLIAILAAVATLSPRVRVWLRLHLAYLHAGRAGVSMLLCLAVFALFGMAISLLLKTLWGVTTELHWYQFTWGFALAWVMGVIIPVGSGGIGIRETVLFKLYGHELGEGLVIGLALVLRIVTSLGDLLDFGLAYWLDSREKKKNICSNAITQPSNTNFDALA